MPFHVFPSHSTVDKPSIEELARRLAKECIQAWLDKWHVIRGDLWQPAIEKALAESEAHEALVCNWPQLRMWIDADRAGFRTRARITESARDRKKYGRDNAYVQIV